MIISYQQTYRSHQAPPEIVILRESRVLTICHQFSLTSVVNVNDILCNNPTNRGKYADVVSKVVNTGITLYARYSVLRG